MKYSITIENQALKDINYFKKHDKTITKKIQNLLLEISKTPFIGIGKPEALRFDLTGYWSRRITAQHRLIYKVLKNEILIISCRFHY